MAGLHMRTFYTGTYTGRMLLLFSTRGCSFSGDSLFCGSVGRRFSWGSMRTLVVLTQKLMPLPENTIVYPGHDIETTIEQERMYNPFL